MGQVLISKDLIIWLMGNDTNRVTDTNTELRA